MPDVLTKSEREALRRFQGKVTVCPPRTHSDMEQGWQFGKSRGLGPWNGAELKSRDWDPDADPPPVKASEFTPSVVPAPAPRARKRGPHLNVARDAVIRRMVAEDATAEAIAAETGLALGSVMPALKRLGLFETYRARHPARSGKACPQRDAEIARLARAGAAHAEISREVGITEQSVRKAISRLGLQEEWRAARPKPARRRRSSSLRAVYEQLAAEELTQREMAERLGITPSSVCSNLKRFGLQARPSGAKGFKVDPDRDARIVDAALEALSTSQIAKKVGMSVSGVGPALKRLGVYDDWKAARAGAPRAKPARKAKTPASVSEPNPGDTVAVRKQRRAGRRVAQVQDRRRFKQVPVPMGDAKFNLAEDHGAVTAAEPLYPNRVLHPDDPATAEDSIFKDGCHNSKIGGDVLVGRLKGARIFTLTLAERTTCPRTCVHWRSCYGNADPHARRWLPGPALEARIDREIAALCARHDQVLVRLHYLGDFYSADYVDLWAQLLTDHENLSAFGFTAHHPATELGALINAWRVEFGYRFAIRHSNLTGKWGSFTIDFPTARRRIGDAVVCPEQRDAMSGGHKLRHCGNCGLCWQADVPVAFVEH